MLSSAARISSTSQMLRSWVVFLGASTGTGLLMRMPHSTASRKELCSSWWTSWRVVPERVRFCCLGSKSIRNSATVTVDGDRQLPHAHPRILLPQNRCLPHLLTALFLRQPEPRCNTHDFASKVVCQRGAAAPLETQEKRPSTALLILGQCADPLAHGLDQRNDKRIPHGEIAQSFRHPGCPIIREAVEPFAFDGR